MSRYLSFSQLLLLIAALSAPTRARAQSGDAPPPAPAPKIQVQPLTPDADLSAFNKDSRYETHAVPSGRPESDLLSPQERDRLISKAGLTAALAGWDAVDRDVLLLRARTLSFEQLRAHYPKLAVGPLHEFQALVHGP